MGPATPTVASTVATPTSMPTESCSRSSMSLMLLASVSPTLVSPWPLSTTALLPLLPLTPPRLPRPRLPSLRPTPPRRLLSPPLPRGRRGRLTLPFPTPPSPSTQDSLHTTPMLDLATLHTMLDLATLPTTPTATDLDPTTDEQ